MALPANFDPFVKRCYEVLCRGKGAGRLIQAGRFAGRLFEGQDASNQHKESLAAAQRSPTLVAGIVAVVIESWDGGTDATQEYGDRAQYDVRLRVDVSYATPNPSQRSAGAPAVDLITQALTQAASDGHDIRRALMWAPNLVQTEDGTVTGVPGGGGIFAPTFGPVRHDAAAQRVTATLYFRAVVFLALGT